MHKTIVTDTSSLLLLNKIGQLYLLNQLFGTKTITNTILKEFQEKLPDFFEIEDSKDIKYKQILEVFLDKCEASAIVLTMEKENCLLIIDELKGRRETRFLNINFTQTLGLFIPAKEKGLINSESEIIDKIIKTDFRISSALIKETKRQSNVLLN